jgi:putative ABC transport system permease protein
MFFFTYLARELRRRLRQAVFIALGLAIGVGLVLTVTAASAGVRNAQSDVLKGLYGVGTDITVTGTPPSAPPGGGGHIRIEKVPGGTQMCVSGVCHALKVGYTFDSLGDPTSWPISGTAVSKVAAVKDVTAAAGGLLLTDNRTTITPSLPKDTSFTVDGADISQRKLGPLSDAAVSSGRAFTASDADQDVALVDQGYAASSGLKVGGTVKIAGTTFTIIGLLEQPEASSPPDVYIPLARAQAVTGQDPVAAAGSMTNEVNTIYVTAASAADIATVPGEIARLLPTAQITTPSSLAAQVTGSLTSAAKLATDLGKWLSVLVLTAAFAAAVLLTMAAVARRVREFELNSNSASPLDFADLVAWHIRHRPPPQRGTIRVRQRLQSRGRLHRSGGHCLGAASAGPGRQAGRDGSGGSGAPGLPEPQRRARGRRSGHGPGREAPGLPHRPC